MKRFFVALACLLLAVACSSGGSDPPPCSDGAASQPSGPVIFHAHRPPIPFPGSDSGAGDADAACSDSATLDAPEAADDTARSNDLTYHGGPVMAGGIVAHLIWYGDWSKSGAKGIIPEFVASIGGSAYFQINAAYSGRVSTADGGFDPDADADSMSSDVLYVANDVRLGLQVDDAYSKGSSLSVADVFAIVEAQVAAGALPADVGAVYVVLTSRDVAQHDGFFSFCSAFCGWHDRTTMLGFDAKVIFVGDPSGCLDACTPDGNRTASPNGDVGADAMASVVAHELDEAATDPDIDAWFYGSGGFYFEENADRCAWTFGADSWIEADGSTANLKLGGRDWYVQQNWVLPTSSAPGHCAMHP